jgi:hypothetical protein
VGQTAAQAKREVDETRAHLTQTIEALQLRARRNLDLKTQMRTNRGLQLGVLAGAAAIAGLVTLLVLRRQRETTAQRLARKLRLDELRARLSDFREDARAWTAAQKRIVEADSKSQRAAVERKESFVRRVGLAAAEAAAVALAGGLAKSLLDRINESARVPHDRAHPTAVVSRKH